MPRENRVHDLRHHRVVIPNDARKYRAAIAQPRHQVLAQLIFDPPRTEALCGKGTSAQLAQSPDNTHGGTPTGKPYVDYTALVETGLAPSSLNAAGDAASRVSTGKR